MIEEKKYTLVTGASSGIGRQIAIRLSEKYNVIINGRNSERLFETKSKCLSSNDVLIWEFDLSAIQEVESSLALFVTDNGIEINNFVHSAGYMKMLPLKMVSTKELVSIDEK